jgi:hypothetical protein
MLRLYFARITFWDWVAPELSYQTIAAMVESPMRVT